jgi:coproporphyrinogen III oxidase-like Fe-S oxidoreductase
MDAMSSTWVTRIVDEATRLYYEWGLNVLPEGLRRNSLDYYYLSVWPGLGDLSPAAGMDLPTRPGRVGHAYIHIPFCSGVCSFCSYLVTTTTDARTDPRVAAYVDLLLTQARNHQRETELAFDSVYLGGGTPGLLPPDQMARLLDGLDGLGALSPATIGTMELHPELFAEPARLHQVLDVLAAHQIRRVSIGFQSRDDSLLAATNRRHDSGFLPDAAETLRRRGFRFNVDLMYGLPGQTVTSWVESLEAVLATTVKPDSVSTYFTFIDFGTRMWRDVVSGAAGIASHRDIQICHIAAQLALEAAGYVELPNDFYAVDAGDPAGFEQTSLPSEAHSLALGAGGYGYYPGVQYFNEFNLREYASAVRDGRAPVWRAAVLTPEEDLRRDIMFSLKNSPWLDTTRCIARYGVDPLIAYARQFDELLRLNLISVSNSRVRLTPKGRLVVEEIACQFASERARAPVPSAERNLVRKHHYAPTYARLGSEAV